MHAKWPKMNRLFFKSQLLLRIQNRLHLLQMTFFGFVAILSLLPLSSCILVLPTVLKHGTEDWQEKTKEHFQVTHHYSVY